LLAQFYPNYGYGTSKSGSSLSPRLDAALTKSHKAAISKRKVVQCQCEKIKLEKLSYTIACGGQYLKLIVDFAHDPDDIKL
jgi:hypothetical protein